MSKTNLGIIIIGRNEGERLLRCIASLNSDYPAVYVDSGSTDNSVAAARRLGIEVVILQPPFSAAGARNKGFAKLKELHPELEFLQFVDGDCELIDGWLDCAVESLRSNSDTAIVCGNVLERQPDASIYNRLSHLEWQRNPGPIKACGGIFMIRAPVFSSVGGFREDVIAAEDDELCLRVRQRDWKIVHLDKDMVYHDTAMFHFSQWWKRAKRAGHAYAQGAGLHGKDREKHFVRNCRSTWFWALGLPVAAALSVIFIRAWGLLLLLLYPLLFYRIYRRSRRRGWSSKDARTYAIFTSISKLPALMGMLQYYRSRCLGRRPRLIEYKTAQQPLPSSIA